MNKDQLLIALPDIFYLAGDGKKTVMWKHIDRKYFTSDWAMENHNRERANTPAGTKAKDGYIRVQWKNRKYSAHHIAFALQNGDWPKEEYQIDHETRDRSDQSKLIESTAKENAANRGGKFDKSLDYNSLTTFQRMKAASGKISGVINIPIEIPKAPYQDNIKVSNIELFGPNSERLSARTEYNDVNKEEMRQEVDSIGFTFFEPLQVVRVSGQGKTYLADGFYRLRAYETDSRFDEVPVIVWEIENEADLVAVCRDISAEFSNRPSNPQSQEDRSNGLYDRIWETAIIDKVNKIVKWNGKVAELSAKYRCGLKTAYYMRNIVKHFIRHGIEKESYYVDRFVYNKGLTEKNESVNMERDERDQMTVDIIAQLSKFIKESNSYSEAISDPENLARILEVMSKGTDNFKGAVEVAFNLNAPITPKRIDPIKLNPTKTQDTVDKLDWD